VTDERVPGAVARFFKSISKTELGSLVSKKMFAKKEVQKMGDSGETRCRFITTRLSVV
tara:strand:- start:201 stop:374 length:174 start_codon:yes stop_codon:yes gene_type:complete